VIHLECTFVSPDGQQRVQFQISIDQPAGKVSASPMCGGEFDGDAVISNEAISFEVACGQYLANWIIDRYTGVVTSTETSPTPYVLTGSCVVKSQPLF
jgi:hypothetical protein